MQKVILVILCCFVSIVTTAQFTYKIKADSLKVTNDSCSAELILENSTKNVNGFLYNKGNGRTEFRKGLIKLNDSVYVIGGDTLRTGSGGGGGLWTSAGSGNIYNTDTIGKVGIGTSTPQEPLDVKGDVNVSDTLRGRIVQIGTRLVSVTDGYTDFLIKNKTSGFTEAQMYYHPIYGVWNLATYRDYGGHQFRINSRIPFNIDTAGAAAQYTFRVGKVWLAHPSSVLDVDSDKKGALLPRMTSSQRTGIASPAIGLIAYDTDSSRYMINASSGWRGLAYTGEANGTSQWTTTGSDIYYNTGKIGIGVLSPTAMTDIQIIDSNTVGLKIKASTGQDSALIDVKNTLSNSIFTLENNKAAFGATAYDYYNGTNFKGLNIYYSSADNAAGLVLSDIGMGGATVLRSDAYSSLQVRNTSGGFSTVVTNAIGNPSDGTVLSNGYGQWKLNSNLLIGSGSYPTSSFHVEGTFATGYASTATSMTLGNHYTMNVTTSGQTITLPSAVDIAGRTYVVKLTASGSCTVATSSSQTIDGAASYSLSAQWKYVTVQSDNANWIIIGNN